MPDVGALGGPPVWVGTGGVLLSGVAVPTLWHGETQTVATPCGVLGGWPRRFCREAYVLQDLLSVRPRMRRGNRFFIQIKTLVAK